MLLKRGNAFALVLLLLFWGLLLISSSCHRKTIHAVDAHLSENVPHAADTIRLDAPKLANPAANMNLPPAPYMMWRFEKMPCYGNCPVFEVKCFSDGRVIWKGESHTERMGIYQTYLSPTQRERIKAKFEETQFFSLLDHYPSEGPYLSELPNTFLYYSDGEKEKSISQNYLTPTKLLDLQDFLMSILNNLQWQLVEQPK